MAASARLTVPEGLTIPEVAAIVAERVGIPTDSFVDAARDTALARELGVRGSSLEGFLHPETYAVPLGSSATLVMTLGDMKQVYVDGKVDESDIGKVYLGQPGKIKVESFKDKSFSGKVTKIQDRQIGTDMLLANWEDTVVYIQDGAVWSVRMAPAPI